MIFSMTRFFYCFRYTLILTRGCPESRCGESRWKWFWGIFRIFAEFSRKFARKVHEEPHGLGLRFFFCTIAKVFRGFQVARDSFSLLKPRKLRSRLSKFRIFALIVLLRLEATFSKAPSRGVGSRAENYVPIKMLSLFLSKIYRFYAHV